MTDEFIDLEDTETPQGTPDGEPEEVIDLEDTETPQGTPDVEPEEVIDLEDTETPQGLPQTGVVGAGVLYGIGSACIALGATLTIRVRKKED